MPLSCQSCPTPICGVGSASQPSAVSRCSFISGTALALSAMPLGAFRPDPPDFANKKWVGFDGDIVDAPFMKICRSQIDVQFNGSTEKLLEEMKGFHWMTSYGDYVAETGYALKKLGVDMVRI